MPVVRTMVPMVAGAGTMPYRRFFTFNVIGAFLWGVCITLAGYFLSDLIGDSIDKYLLPVILLIVIISVAPTAIHIWKGTATRSRRTSCVAWQSAKPARPAIAHRIYMRLARR